MGWPHHMTESQKMDSHQDNGQDQEADQRKDGEMITFATRGLHGHK